MCRMSYYICHKLFSRVGVFLSFETFCEAGWKILIPCPFSKKWKTIIF
jgi:hypothetical protein